MTVSVVVADANILFSRTLHDYFLYAADEGAIEIHWSQEILDEMSRNLRERLVLSHADTARLEQLMNDFIEYALVDVDAEDLATVAAVEMTPRTATSSRRRSQLTRTSCSQTPPDTSRDHGWQAAGSSSSMEVSC